MTVPANRLPGRLDGLEGLLELAKLYSHEQVFDLIVMCRTARGRETDVGGAALTAIGNALVQREMNDKNIDRDTAKRQVAHRLGYHDAGSRSNFYQILKGGRAPDKRPSSRQRGKAGGR